MLCTRELYSQLCYGMSSYDEKDRQSERQDCADRLKHAYARVGRGFAGPVSVAGGGRHAAVKTMTAPCALQLQ